MTQKESDYFLDLRERLSRREKLSPQEELDYFNMLDPPPSHSIWLIPIGVGSLIGLVVFVLNEIYGWGL